MKKFLVKNIAAAMLGIMLLGALAMPVRLTAQAPAQNVATQPAAPAAQASDAATQKPDQEEPDENDKYKQSAMVKMIGGWFGLSAERAAVVFWVLNFAILALAIGWALLKALPKMFRSRSERIQKQLVDARTATEQANARLAEVEKKLTKLDGEIASLHTAAQNDMVGEEKRMRSALEAEKHRILAASELEIATAAALAQRQLKQYAAGLAIDHAIKDMDVNSRTERLMVEEFAAGIGGSSNGGNGSKSAKVAKAAKPTKTEVEVKAVKAVAVKSVKVATKTAKPKKTTTAKSAAVKTTAGGKN